MPTTPTSEAVESVIGGITVPHESAARRPLGRLIHVLYIVDRLYIHGGGEQALIRLVQSLPRNRFRISVVTFDANPTAAKTVREAGADLQVLPMRRVYDWRGLRTALELRRILRSGGVDVVHTFFETSNTWGGLIAKLSRVPVLISSRRDMGILRLGKHHLAYKVVNRLCDGFVAVSDSVRDFCVENEGLDPERIFTAHNGVDLEGIDAADGMALLKAALGLADGSPVVATVANIRRVKGIDILLRTAAVVREEFPDVRFVIAGNSLEHDHYEELQDMLRRLHLGGNVTFLGRFDDVFSLLKLSNIFCLLSRSEGFSNAMLEAMGAGLPCVVTSVGGTTEAIEDRQNGFLVSPEQPEAAAQRILTLLRNPEEARRIGRAARQTVEKRFTSEIIADRLAGVYQALLAEREVATR